MSGNNSTSERAQTGRSTSGPSRGGPSYGLEDAVKLWPTPHGICAPGPRCPGPSGNELGREVNRREWPTPDAACAQVHEDPETWERRRQTMLAKGYNGNGCGTPLGMAVKLWPTPTGGDSKGSGSRNVEGSSAHPGLSLTDAARGDGGKGRTWATPQARDHRSGKTSEATATKNSRPLNEQVETGGPTTPRSWPTPKGSPSGRDYARADREESGGDDLATAAARLEKGSLNPSWVEWLMGWPLGWTSLDRIEQSTFRAWLLAFVGACPDSAP